MKWFITQSEKVQGPWSTEQLTNWLKTTQDHNNILIFRRGLTEWLSATQFLSGDMGSKEEPSVQPQPTEDTLWHYALEGVSHGPMNRQELVQQLARVKNNASAVLWTRGMKAWVPIYEFSDIMDDVGINRRQYPRITISGTVKIQMEQKSYEGVTQSLSENGFGAQMALPSLEAGQLISFEIQSPNLSSVLRGRAEVRYVTADLHAGFKFHLLDSTSRNLIHDILKQPVRTNKAA